MNERSVAQRGKHAPTVICHCARPTFDLNLNAHFICRTPCHTPSFRIYTPPLFLSFPIFSLLLSSYLEYAFYAGIFFSHVVNVNVSVSPACSQPDYLRAVQEVSIISYRHLQPCWLPVIWLRQDVHSSYFDDVAHTESQRRPIALPLRLMARRCHCHFVGLRVRGPSFQSQSKV